VIVVYNHAFCPREYLREKLALQIINFMRNCVALDDKVRDCVNACAHSLTHTHTSGAHRRAPYSARPCSSDASPCTRR
jgi:hypothetical protein